MSEPITFMLLLDIVFVAYPPDCCHYRHRHHYFSCHLPPPLPSAVAVGNLQAVGLARALEERRAALLNKELDLDALFRLDEDGDGKVTLVEFLTGALHQISGIDPEKEIHPWIRRFHELDVDGNGYLDENVSLLICGDLVAAHSSYSSVFMTSTW